MSVSDIQCADDLAALAGEAVQQVRIHKQYRDLIGAVLMANHIADWHYVKDLNRNAFDKPAREAMKACYPEWDILRELAKEPLNNAAQSAARRSIHHEISEFVLIQRSKA